ncbi:SUR7/PalI family-domain-containing protein [Xylariaceae sp. FL0255]|nr:SUR7/PalI family-domain-containing protein [Xylariaceae sp. FL0255]
MYWYPEKTRARRTATIVASVCYLIAVVFLILVEIGSVRGTKILGDIYFFKLNTANVLAQSTPSTLTLQNSIAQTLGLHDFYQAGLWSFCEGYLDEGITDCSKPSSHFWFNPVEILLNELFAGASIALPSEVNEILTILRLVSHIMFGFFLTGLLLNAALVILSPIAVYSRWLSLPFGLLSFLSALVVIVAAGLGTAIAYVFKYALSSQPDLGVDADVGVKMLAFGWIAAGFTLLAFTIHAGLGCCGTSRRDIRKGWKKRTEKTNSATLGAESPHDAKNE